MSKKKNKKLKVSKKRFQKAIKRKRIAETKRKQKVALMTPSTGNINLYHFTGEDSVPSINVPSTEDLAEMSWDEVHNLANSAFRSA